MNIITFFYNIWHAQRNAQQVGKLYQIALDLNAEISRLERAQNQRGAGGKFVKKTPA